VLERHATSFSSLTPTSTFEELIFYYISVEHYGVYSWDDIS